MSKVGTCAAWEQKVEQSVLGMDHASIRTRKVKYDERYIG